MKKFYVILAFLGLFVLLHWHLTKPTPLYLSPNSNLSEEKPDLGKPQPIEIPVFLLKINENNNKIKSIFIQNMKMKIHQTFTFSVNGQLAMQKDKNFRLKVWKKISGLEMDIGSNKDLFWFWSKRLEVPGLYFSNHENLNKTNLKTPLNPAWIMESLNVGQVPVTIPLVKYKDYWVLIEERVSGLGETVTVKTLIDPKKPAVIGRYLYDKKNNLVVSAEIQEFTTTETGILLPKTIFIVWFDEGVSMKWDLSNIELNSNINKSNWTMPNLEPQFDIGK